FEQLPKAANQQSGAYKEQDGESDFRNDESAAQLSAATASGTAAAILERVLQIGLCAIPGRSQAEDQTGKNRRNKGEGKDERIDANLVYPRNAITNQGADGADSPIGNDETQHSSRESEQEAFRDELADQA